MECVTREKLLIKFLGIFLRSRLLWDLQMRRIDDKPSRGQSMTRVSAKEVASVLCSMKGGKSPGHDGLSVEHLRYAKCSSTESYLVTFQCVLYTFLLAPVVDAFCGDTCCAKKDG